LTYCQFRKVGRGLHETKSAKRRSEKKLRSMGESQGSEEPNRVSRNLNRSDKKTKKIQGNKNRRAEEEARTKAWLLVSGKR